MHEKAHGAAVTDNSKNISKELPAQPPKKSRAEIVEEIAAPMREFALENPCFTKPELDAALASRLFLRLIQISKTFAISVILIVSPSDSETEPPFWHCSMSLVSATGKTKSVQLWMKRETANIKNLLSEFLSKVGKKETTYYLQKKHALHIHRDLSDAELELICWESK